MRFRNEMKLVESKFGDKDFSICKKDGKWRVHNFAFYADMQSIGEGNTIREALNDCLKLK